MSQDFFTNALSIVTLVMSVVAAVYAFLAYHLKSGIEIWGSYSITSSVAAEDRYVSEVTLENLKDRAVVIFQVLLEVDHGYYIEVDNLEDGPLILRPFEAFHRQYQPIDLYSVSMRRIRLKKLLENHKTRLRLVLSTSKGRYNVSQHIKRWHPVGEFFRNYLTAIISPYRTTYEDKSYGSGTKFIVKIATLGGESEVIPIYPIDHEVKKFRGFQLTSESLQSKEALEIFLLERAVAGDLRCSDLSVFDLEEWREQVYRDLNKKEVQATPRGWFRYRVLGWFLTKWEDFRMGRINRANQRRHREALKRAKKAPSESQDTTA